MQSLTIAANSGNAEPIILGFAIWLAALTAYCAPAAIAILRHVPNAGSVVIIDLLLGWTLIGWIVALAMACRSKPRYYPAPPAPWQPRP